jgi:hypothetical protein
LRATPFGSERVYVKYMLTFCERGHTRGRRRHSHFDPRSFVSSQSHM